MSCGKLYCQSSLYGWNGFLIFVSVLSEAVLSVFLVWLEWLLNICQCLVGSCTVSLPDKYEVGKGFLTASHKSTIWKTEGFKTYLRSQCLVGSCTVSLPCMVGMAS